MIICKNHPLDKAALQAQIDEWEEIADRMFITLRQETSGPREAYVILELMKIAMEEHFDIEPEKINELRNLLTVKMTKTKQ